MKRCPAMILALLVIMIFIRFQVLAVA